MGIPTQWSQYLFRLVALLLPLVFLSPTFRRIISCRRNPASLKLRRAKPLLRQGLILLIVYVMFISPEGFYQLSHAVIDPDMKDKAVFYTYDDNGSLIKKILAGKDEADPDTNFTEKTLYTYNLQNRLAEIRVTTDGSNWDVTKYRYNPDGIRERKVRDPEGTPVVTNYLIDAYNHTGYAQVFIESISGTNSTAYCLGSEVLSQAFYTDSPKYLLCDGQGTVRQIANSDGEVLDGQSHYYDAYGGFLGWSDDPQSNLRYTGQQWDESAQMYYLRARYYNPLNGRFNRPDPFSGSPVDPRSLHKYSYCAGNPINMLDPSGLDWFFANLGTEIHKKIYEMYELEHMGDIRFGKSIPGLAGALLPDIMDFKLKEIGEIKPLSAYGLATGPPKLLKYLEFANKLNIPGSLDKPWTQCSWKVGFRYVPVPKYPEYLVFTLANAWGLIFYKAFKKPDNLLSMASLTAITYYLSIKMQDVIESLKAAVRQGSSALEGIVAYLDYQSELAYKVVLSQQAARYGVYAVVTYTMISLSINMFQLSYSRF